MKPSGFLFVVSTACVLVGQQAPAPRPPVVPLTREELEAIPATPPRAGLTVKKTLFDGKTLHGWRGNPDWWSVKDGEIVGKFGAKVPTSFLFTDDSYSDFRLTLWSKMVESDNHAGVCFWSVITERPDNKWYTQGPLVMFPKAGMWDYVDAKGLRVNRVSDENPGQHEWIQVEILARGNRVRTAFNGKEMMEWRESDASRIKAGPLGIQLHAWTAAQEVRYKDIVVETFPKEDKLLTVRP